MAKRKSKQKHLLQVGYHVNADKSKVNRLVREFGDMLVTAVMANRDAGRTPQAIWMGEGYILSAMSAEHAAKQGMVIQGGAKFFVWGMPNDDSCPVVQMLKRHLANDPTTVGVEFTDSSDE